MSRVIEVRLYKQGQNGHYVKHEIGEDELDKSDFDFIHDNDFCLSIEDLTNGAVVCYLGETWDDENEVLEFFPKGDGLRKMVHRIVMIFKKIYK